MKDRIRYFFSRLLVLYVALHILDVSVDLDHIALKSTRTDTENIDDTDSFSEFIVELITGDSNTVAEGCNDDHNPLQKAIHKYVPFVVIISERNTHDLNPWFLQAKSIETEVYNTNFQQEDFSSPVYSPPKSTKFSA